jgi:cytochrome c5
MARCMTRRFVRLTIGFGAAVLWATACQPPQSEERAPADQRPTSDLVAASAMVGLPAGTAPADLPDPASEGALTFEKYCSACHGIPSPSAHSATDWPVVLRRMWLRTEGLPAGYTVPVPDARERVIIVNYVLDHAMQVAGTELPAGPGRDLFTSTCNRCHELPDPRQHSEQDWAAVVIRMRQHMVQMLRQSPAQSEVQDIILYLERASKAES